MTQLSYIYNYFLPKVKRKRGNLSLPFGEGDHVKKAEPFGSSLGFFLRDRLLEVIRVRWEMLLVVLLP
jgi:hypothetical protein